MLIAVLGGRSMIVRSDTDGGVVHRTDPDGSETDPDEQRPRQPSEIRGVRAGTRLA